MPPSPKEISISSGESIAAASEGLALSPMIDASGYFNHCLYIYFGAVGAACTTLTISLLAYSPAGWSNPKLKLPAISTVIGQVDFTANPAGPWDMILPFGGNATLSSPLPGSVFYKYVVKMKNDVAGPSAANKIINIKAVWLTMTNFGAPIVIPKG